LKRKKERGEKRKPVTVSIGEETKGVLRGIFLEILDSRLTSAEGK